MMLPGSFSREMLGPFFANGLHLEEAVFPQPLLGQQGFRPIPQLTAKPAIEWNAEAGFRALDEVPGHASSEQFAKNPFSLMPAQLHGHWKPPGKLNHAMIEQWHSRFQADGHAGAVHFGEHVVWQKRQRIQKHHLLCKLRQFRPVAGRGYEGWRLYSADDDSRWVGRMGKQWLVDRFQIH